MIFKTFDSDKDTFSSKFGILGKSFEDIGNRFKKVSDELIVTNDYTISNIANAWKNSSVKKDLSDKFIITKSDIQDKLKDLSVYEKNPQGILDNLLEQKELVDSNQSSWQKYFEGLSEGEKWQVKFVQENDLTKVSLDDVKNAQNAARQSAIAYNNGLEQMTIGAKAANIALEGLKMAANMIAGMLIAEGIQLAVTAIDNYIHRVEKANEAMNEAVSEYDSAKTALKDTTSQLEEQNKSIDELNKKDKLTYVEQEELDKLKEATRQLELQKNIEEKEKANSAREAADKTVTAFNKQYGKGDIDKNAVDTQLAQSKATGVFQEARNSDDIVGNLASFEYYTEQMEKTQKRYNKALKSGSKDDIKYYEENLQDCIDTVDEYTTSLNNNIEDLTKKKNNLQDAYDNAVKKKSNGESLSSDEKNTISKYQEIADIIKLIYSYTDKAGWNNSQISEIFNTNGIEKSKEDLKQLAQEGKLTEEELQKYPNLMNAINNAEFLGEKDSNLKVFCDDLNAGVDAIEDTGNAADSAAPSIASFDEAWLNLKNTDDSDLKGAADDLLDLANAGQLTGNALEGLAGGQQLMNETGLSAEALAQKINGLVNASTQLSSMSTQISKISDMLADKKNGTVASASDLAGFDVSVRGLESWDEFEEVMGSSESSMDQCQKAANALATEWVNDGNFLANLTDENKQYYITQLEDMGVKNAEQIVTEALAKKEEELRFEKLLSADASTDLQNATVADILKLQNLGDITEQEKAKLAAFTLEKQYCNKNTIVTDADCQNIYTLAKMAGAGTEALNKLAALKQRLSDNPIMSNEMRNNINNAIQDIVNGVTTSAGAKLDIPQVKVNSSGSSSYKSPSSKKSKSKSKTKSDAAEVFDFIEIKLNNLTDKASKAKDKIDDLLTFGQKKNQTKKAIEATTKAITAQEKAYKKYMAYANKAAKTQNSKKTTSSSSSTGGNAVYDTATDYLGLKYVWGGASLTKGADCSGFTQQIYKKFGVSLPHHAADQAKMGTKITSKKNLQAGDLVFFGSKNNITHVGIYGGDGKFIESPHTGASVRVSKLSSRKDFVSGSRFSKINNATSTSSSSGKNVKKVKKGVSSKTLEHYKKLIRNGTLDADGIQTIKNENLKNAMKDYQTWYEKAKSCKEQVTSLTDQLKDLYETLANNPIDSASDKIEKLGTKMDILNAKVGNLTFNPTKKIGTSDIDNLYKQIIKNYNSQLSASKTAYTGATKSYKSNKSSLTKSLKKTKAKNIGLTQNEFNSIKSNLKSNKSISYNLINKIENDTLRKKCIAHNEYLLAKNTATDNYNQAKEDHTSNVRQTRKDHFDEVQARYDNKAGLIEQRKNAVSNSLSIAEAKGLLIGEAYYTRQADAVKSDMQLKQEEAEELAKKLSTIKFGSDEWYEAQEALNGVYESIQQDEQELAEFQKSINELKFDRFDELLDKLGDITDETDFLIDMLDSDNLFDSDTGMITQDGITAMGLTAQNYDTYLAEAQKYKDAIADLNEMYNEGKIGLTDYNSKLREYQQGQRDSIKSANEAKKSLVAYVKQGLDAQNDALEEAISKKKELLETEKDLKEFQDKIADQNKNIAKLQKQIAALEGDDSEENRKKLQQLKSDLKDAEKEQSDTLYDRSVSDQEKALDDMLTKSKESAEDYLKDTNKVFSDALTYVNANSSQVASNIEKIAKDTGYDVSTYIVNAWKDGGDAVGDYASTLSSNIPNITAQLGLIASSWQSICKAADEAAEASAKYAETKVTDTQGIGSSNDSGTSSGNGSVSSGSNDDDKQQELNKLRKKASDITEWISKHSVSATHKKSYYGSLNQYLYDKQHGQVLSKANEVALAKKLGVSVKSDLSGKNDREKITSALKKLIKDASFSTGGVATNLVKISGEDGISFIQRGEAVFSKEDTQALLSFKPVIPQINSIVDNLKNIPEKVSSQSPTYQIDNRTIVEGVATDQIVKQMEGVAQKQAENVVRKINQATYAKGVRK
ncbi:NlpC/P60 family protein [Roseburia faecis]|uniref:NlpC/P60 family protein n=1 Tax=Roseburia faecis TaxID=301302 RepID=UPI0031B5A305